MIRQILPPSLALAACVLCGCKQSVDLAAVQALATSAAASQTAFNALATDYYDTCERRTTYQTIGSAVEAYFPRPLAPSAAATPPPAGALSNAEISNLPASELLKRLTLSAAQSLSPTQLARLLERPDGAAIVSHLPAAVINATLKPPADAELANGQCYSELAASNSWISANSLVVGYFAALGKLAGGSTSTDPYGLTALAKGVSATTEMPAPQATAIANLATGVITQVYDAKRRSELSTYIPEADTAVGNAITLLENLAKDHYANALGQERLAANRFLERNLQLAEPGEQAFEVLSYADAWSTRVQEIDAHVAAINSYVSAWEKLRSGHADLLKAIAKNDPDAAFNVAEGIYNSLAPDVSALNKAFSKGK